MTGVRIFGFDYIIFVTVGTKGISELRTGGSVQRKKKLISLSFLGVFAFMTIKFFLLVRTKEKLEASRNVSVT